MKHETITAGIPREVGQLGDLTLLKFLPSLKCQQRINKWLMHVYKVQQVTKLTYLKSISKTRLN